VELRRILKPILFACASLLTAFDLLWIAVRGSDATSMIGLDYEDATARWLSSGVFYQSYQLAGPYSVEVHEVLYPPIALVLFAPFTVLPAIFWWAIPTGVVAWSIWSWRPSRVTWCVLVALLLWPWSLMLYSYGNPCIWIAALIAGGLRWGWPAALIAFKPQFAVLALIGIRHRSWWILSAGLAVVSLTMLPLWMDYLTVMRNARWDVISPFYWLNNVPLLAVPVVAWVGSSSRSVGRHSWRLDLPSRWRPSETRVGESTD
jgi:hypothetical protein